MGKNHRRSAKKRNVKKLNHPSNTEQSKKTETPVAIQSPPTAFQNIDVKPDGKKSVSRTILGALISLGALGIGFFGYSELWPKVIIEPSPATSQGLLSYQMNFQNQACYPVKVTSVVIAIVNLKWLAHTNPPAVLTMDNLATMTQFSHLQIGGHDSTTIKCNQFRFESPPKLFDGSKVILTITYRLPMIHIEKSDSVLFESATDNSGNSIWIKKPIGKFANYKPQTYLADAETNEIY